MLDIRLVLGVILGGLGILSTVAILIISLLIAFNYEITIEEEFEVE